jgi:hypothetical protein
MNGFVSSRRQATPVDYHMFYLRDVGVDSPPPPLPSNGLISCAPGLCAIFTGASSGHVMVEVDPRETPPPPPGDSDYWDEIVETSVYSPAGQLKVACLMADAPDFPLLTTTGPGDYRIRASAKGRDIKPDGVAFEPIEEYYIVVWPQYPAEDEVVYRHHDRYGKQFHS